MKQKLNKLTRFGILAIGIAMLLTNCQKDDDFKTVSLNQDTPNFKISKISNHQIQQNTTILAKLKKLTQTIETNKQTNKQSVANNKEVHVSEYDFSINTNTAKYVENADNSYHSYTFPVTRAVDNGLIENLLFSLQDDGTYKTILVQYNLTKADITAYNNGNEIDFTNKLNYIGIDSNEFVDNVFSKFFTVDCLSVAFTYCAGELKHPEGMENGAPCPASAEGSERVCSSNAGGSTDVSTYGYGGQTNSETGNGNPHSGNNTTNNPDVTSPVILTMSQKLSNALGLENLSDLPDGVETWANKPKNEATVYNIISFMLINCGQVNTSTVCLEANEFVNESLNILTLPIINSNSLLDYEAQILRMTNHLRLFGNIEDEIYADYIDSLLPSLGDMLLWEVKDLYLQVKQTCNQLTIKYAQEILTVVATDLVIPVISYALFEATTGTAIKLLQKIPLPMVLRGARLNKMIIKTTELGGAGVFNSRIIPNSTVSKTETLFASITKDAISVAPSTSNPSIIVAQMGSGKKIILRPNSTTVPEAIRVIEYQNFNSLLGTSSYTLKFIP